MTTPPKFCIELHLQNDHRICYSTTIAFIPSCKSGEMYIRVEVMVQVVVIPMKTPGLAPLYYEIERYSSHRDNR